MCDNLGLDFGVSSFKKEGLPLPVNFLGLEPGDTEEANSLAFTLPNLLASICIFIKDLDGESSPAEVRFAGEPNFVSGVPSGERVFTVPPDPE